MRLERGVLEAVRNGDRAALASDAIFDAALRTDGDRKMDLAAAKAIGLGESFRMFPNGKDFSVEMRLEGSGLKP